MWLLALGRQQEARDSLAEAVPLPGRLAADRPDEFREQLAESLGLLRAVGGNGP